MELSLDGFLGLRQGSTSLFQKFGFQQITMFLDKNAISNDDIGQLTLSEDRIHCKAFQKFPSYDSNLWRLLAEKWVVHLKDLIDPIF